jgi:integrase
MSARATPDRGSSPTLALYLSHWLRDAVAPNREPATYTYYETMVRRYIVPALGSRRLSALHVRDVQAWLDGLPQICQCCAQGKDAARPSARQRCCAIGKCCHSCAGARTVRAARDTLRVALNHARTREELVTGNAAAYASVPSPSPRRPDIQVWTRQEASRFLASARDDNDPLYAAYILVLVSALRRSEVLGLTWSSTDLRRGELDIAWQLQRICGRLIHKKRSGAGVFGAVETVPLPGIGVAALKLRRAQQAAARTTAGGRWLDSDLVFTTRWGTPVEPRNFSRSFDARCVRAGVPQIRVHDTRRTCASLLWELNVHPGIVLRILRHARVAATMTSGPEVSDDAVRAALNKLGDSLGPDLTAQRGQR